MTILNSGLLFCAILYIEDHEGYGQYGDMLCHRIDRNKKNVNLPRPSARADMYLRGLKRINWKVI